MALVPPEPAAYVYLTGDDIVEIGTNETHSVRQVLHWIGFTNVEQRNLIISDLFESFEDLKMLSIKDVENTASSFASR